MHDRDDSAPSPISAVSREPDVFARADVFAAPSEPAPIRIVLPEQAFDPAAIMASVGETPYEWSIASDVLAWGRNATGVLMVGSLAAISSGRNYAKLLAPDATTSRFDAVMKSSQRDGGEGVPYQVQYALHPPGSDKRLWIEDVGRWFADAAGKPARAHGIVRVVNEAPRSGGAAHLPVAVRRPDRRDEPLLSDRSPR
jgi:hypothetical protein